MEAYIRLKEIVELLQFVRERLHAVPSLKADIAHEYYHQAVLDCIELEHLVSDAADWENNHTPD